VRKRAGPCKMNASQVWATHASLVSQTDKQLGKWGAGLGDLAAADPGAKRRGSATLHLKPDKKHGVLKSALVFAQQCGFPGPLFYAADAFVWTGVALVYLRHYCATRSQCIRRDSRRTCQRHRMCSQTGCPFLGDGRPPR
jgi:hypothetical protein